MALRQMKHDLFGLPLFSAAENYCSRTINAKQTSLVSPRRSAWRPSTLIAGWRTKNRWLWMGTSRNRESK